RSTEVKPKPKPIYLNLRQPNRSRDTVADTKIHRIELYVRSESNKKPISAQAGFIHPLWRKHVCLIQGKDLAARLARIAKAGNVIALEYGLLPQVLLKSIVAVQPVVGIEGVAYVCGSLINIYWRGG